jgi:hypothetical protein
MIPPDANEIMLLIMLLFQIASAMTVMIINNSKDQNVKKSQKFKLTQGFSGAIIGISIFVGLAILIKPKCQ